MLLRSRYALIAALAVIAVAGPLVPGTLDVELTRRMSPPNASHWMGTDVLGRDLLGRTIAGASMSLRVSLAAWFAALAVGLLFGSLAGLFAGTIIDWVVSWLIHLVYATPFLIFLVGLHGIIGTGLGSAYVILVVFAWAAPARQTRIAVRGLRTASFVVASRSFGYGPVATFSRVVMPVAARPTIIASLALLPEIIALDAALSFFGLGVQPPEPSLGKLIADGIYYGTAGWWLSLFPVAILATICLAIRFVASPHGDSEIALAK
jgi:peptide/nickel transport system permease protein